MDGLQKETSPISEQDHDQAWLQQQLASKDKEIATLKVSIVSQPFLKKSNQIDPRRNRRGRRKSMPSCQVHGTIWYQSGISRFYLEIRWLSNRLKNRG